MSDNPQKNNDPNRPGKSKSGKKSVTQVGDFELKKRLGKGGMGEVFLARQISLDRLVALKTLSKELSKKDDFVARFLREARSMAKLDHTNVVKVYAVDSYKGLHYAAIEYVDGRSVQDWLDKLSRFSVADAVHVTIVCAEGLQHAHAQNMVHRDIKPDNILLTSKGIIKVADFGLAKVMDEDVSMTQSGTGLGTPLYMAPEQARSAKTVDQRSDIYALGATLYHMLTGALPFTGTTALELIMSKETGRYEPARKVCSDVPERLDLIIDKMMAKDPNHRYSDCEDVIRDLTSLGLHSEALTFIEGAQPVGVGRSMGTSVGGSTAVAGSGRNGGKTSSRRDAKSSETKKAARTWYVQFDDVKGHKVVEKLTTGRILKMLKAGMLTAKAKAKLNPNGTYVPLSKFSEFTDAVENQLTKQTQQFKKDDMKSLYKQVARDEKRRNRWRWLGNKFRGLVGTISLIIWLAVIGVVVWLLITFGRQLFEYLGQKVTEMMS